MDATRRMGTTETASFLRPLSLWGIADKNQKTSGPPVFPRFQDGPGRAFKV